VKVPLTTVDELVSELKLRRVDFKMDIEGAEKRALLGARRTLATYKPQLAMLRNICPTMARPFGWPCVDMGSSVTLDVLYFR
jgi:hypothetical protein